MPSAITGNVLGPASSSSAGLVTTAAQTFAGAKTFNSPPVISDASGIVAATASVPGVVTTGTQTFAGQKTFTGPLQAGGGSYTAGYDFQVANASTGTSVLLKSGNGGSGCSVKFSDPGGSSVDSLIGHLSTTSRFQVRCGSTGGVELSSGATSWAAISDQRLKKNIKQLNYGLSEIVSLNPIRFDYNSDEGDESKRIGFIAQEVKSIIPECVSGSGDEMYSLSTTEMIPALVKAIKELKIEIDYLKSKIP